VKLLRWLFVLGLVPLFAQEWTDFSAPFPIRSAWASDSGVWLATGGGIRFISESMATHLYSASDGLEETGQVAITKADDGNLYSLSETGILARYNGRRFEVVNRSFVESNDPLRNSLMLAKGDYLVLAFSRRLTFFQLSTKLSFISLSSIANKALQTHPINDFHLVGDSLYVAIDSSIYVRNIPFSHLNSEVNFADPSTWSLVQNFATPVKRFWFEGKALRTDTASIGMALADSSGLIARVRPGKAGSVTLQGKNWTDDVFCPSGNCIPFWLSASASGSFWLGDSGTLWNVKSSTRSMVPGWDGFPWAVAAVLTPLSDGGVVAVAVPPSANVAAGETHAIPVTVWWNGSGFFHEVTDPISTVPDDSYAQLAGQPMKTLLTDANGTLLLGTWGAGVIAYANGGFKAGAPASSQLHASKGACFDNWDGANYNLVRGAAHVPGAGGTLFSYWGESRNGGIAYVSPGAQSVSCLPAVTASVFPGPMAAFADAAGNWTVFVSYGNSAGSESGGINKLSTTNPEVPHSFQLLADTMISVGTLGYPHELAWDANSQRLWAISSDKIGYWDHKQDSLVVVASLLGYQSGELTALKIDRHSRLWIGTRDHGAYLATMVNSHPDTLQFTAITPQQGLLSNQVNDIAIQAVTGDVWFAHERGLSRWRNASVRDPSNYQQKGAQPVVAYPNPFRPKIHSHVIFDHLSEGATLRVYDQAGNIVRNFSGNALAGGQLIWDGKNEQGSLVAPGLYHWLASFGSHSQNGRLLVIR